MRKSDALVSRGIKEIWPRGFDFNFENGMSDSQLEAISLRLSGKKEAGPLRSPWLFGMSESKSLGKCFRELGSIPKWLPVPFFSDHGVHLHSEFFPIEQSNESRFHLTWSKWREFEDLPGKTVMRILHPWVAYRRLRNFEKRADAAGSLVFITHSNPSTSVKRTNLQNYFSALGELPFRYRPRGIMLYFADIAKGLHLELRSSGLPVFTAGSIESPFFVDRFYNIASRFEFSTSTMLGSHSFLCEEFGVRFFLFGPREELEDDLMVPFANKQFEREVALERVFSFPPEKNAARKGAVRDALSTDISVLQTSETIATLFKSEFFCSTKWVLAKILRKFKPNFLIFLRTRKKHKLLKMSER